MTSPESIHPKVFISYSHDSPEHADRVLELSNRLRTDGIDTILDQHEVSPPEGWPRWMDKQIRDADFVLMVCTETYYRRVMGEEKPGAGLGVRWEGNLIYQHLYSAGTLNVKFVPVLFESDDTSHIPTPLQGATHYYVSADDGYEELYRHLTNQPRTLQPELGKLRQLESRERHPVFEATLSPTNLPPPDVFVGRADLLAEVRETIRTGGVTILKGEGGMGKSALALTAAHAAHADGELPGGVAWLNCELKPSRDECLRQMAHVFFGDRLEKEDIVRCHERVMTYLRERAALVVFDNFETVASDAALLRWLAEVRPPIRVLVTTREVPPGLHGQVIEVQELPREEAVALFIARAQAAGVTSDQLSVTSHQSQLTTHHSPLIYDLCAAVGDLPLAIELLAARAARTPLPRLLERVRRDLAVLDARGDPTRSERHQSARACFGLSYENLTAEARGVLLRLSVLPDGAGTEVISAVMETDDWDEAVEELVGESVWRLTRGRYTVHPLVRQFALELLGSGRADAERHAARAVTQLAKAKGDMTRRGAAATPAQQGAALDWIETEWRNLMACADIAFAAHDWTTVGDLSDAVRNFFQLRGYWQDCTHLYQRSLTARRNVGDHVGEGLTLNNLGNVYRHQGRWKEAEACYLQSLEIRQEVGDRCGEAQTLNALGVLYWKKQWTEAEACYQQSLTIWREVGDRSGEAQTLMNLGALYREQKQWAEAEDYYQQSLAMARAVGSRMTEGNILNNLGNVYRHQGRWAEAEACCQQGLAIYRELGDRVNEGHALFTLAEVHYLQGQWAEAEEYCQQSLAVWRSVGDRISEGETLKDFAQLRAAQGDLVGALEFGRQAVAVLETTEDVKTLAEARELVAQWERQAEEQNKLSTNDTPPLALPIR